MHPFFNPWLNCYEKIIMRKRKASRILTCLMAVAVIAGSIHWAAADTSEEVYEAQELILAQGAQGYDLTEGIVYDRALYELEVLDTGDFGINVPGAYEVTYSLTPVAETPADEDKAADVDNPDASAPGVNGAARLGTENDGDSASGTDNETGDATVQYVEHTMEEQAAIKTVNDRVAGKTENQSDAEDGQAVIRVNERVIVQAGKSQAKAEAELHPEVVEEQLPMAAVDGETSDAVVTSETGAADAVEENAAQNTVSDLNTAADTETVVTNAADAAESVQITAAKSAETAQQVVSQTDITGGTDGMDEIDGNGWIKGAESSEQEKGITSGDTGDYMTDGGENAPYANDRMPQISRGNDGAGTETGQRGLLANLRPWIPLLVIFLLMLAVLLIMTIYVTVRMNQINKNN